MPAHPALFTIPPSVPFLDTLIEALVDGRLVPGFDVRADPLALARVTLYLPTRRAARALPDLFRTKLGGTCLLPRIRPLGDADEEVQLLTGGPEVEGLPPAIPEMERRLAMTRLVRAWEGALRRDVLGLAAHETLKVPASAADAAWLAADLIALMDEIATEEAGWDGLADLVPEEHARYWQITLDFLKIATAAWPEVLAERGAMDPKARRSALIRREAERLRRAPPQDPVIVAGTTGSIPATADLLAAVAALPKGAIVLPGLDQSLDADAWETIGAPEAKTCHPGHPQYGLKQLLTRLKTARGDVVPLAAPANPALAARDRLVSEAMRPAETTDRWPIVLRDVSIDDRAAAFAGVSVVEARNEADEALTVAVRLRQAIEEGKRAALISPDRMLARRVAVELQRWGIAVDDSAGRPLDQTPPAILAVLAARLAVRGLEPIDLLALLKHPLTRLGLSPKEIRAAARSLERGVLRGPRARPGTAGLAAAVAAARAAVNGRHTPRWKRLVEDDWIAVEDLVARLTEALQPLEALASEFGEVAVARLVEAHVETVSRLARDETGSDAELYAGEAGDALAAVFASLIDAKETDLTIPVFDWPDVFCALISGANVRRRLPGDPRIAILGPLEARLQRPDIVVLGGLNEGVWPARTRNDPWLNRPMKRDIGLDPPERRIGAAAHDFCQGLGAEEVVLTRALRADGAPTVAARWLQRLTTLLGPDVAAAMRRRGEDLRALAALVDHVEGPPRPAARPEPKPPVAARPAELFITDIERLIRDPYAIYARRILRLDEIEPIGGEPGAADRGTLIHDSLADFLKRWNGPFDESAVDALVEIGRAHFAPLDAFPAVRALWWPRFCRVASAFVAAEAERASSIARRHLEIGGGIQLDLAPGRTIRLSGRADRIDECCDGTLSVIDYKTGQAPSQKQVEALLAPQLPLEAALVAAGGFDGVDANLPVGEMAYIRLTGGRRPVEVLTRNPKDATVPELAAEALARVMALLAAYENPDKGYLSRARVFEERDVSGPYDHLARVREWSVEGGEDA